MNEHKRITVKRIIAYVILILFPLFEFILGCLGLFNDVIINKPFVITYLLIPVIAFALLALVVFSNFKTIAKTLLSIFVLVVFFVSFFVCRLLGHFEFLTYENGDDIRENYKEACEMFDALPELEDLGDYTEAEYYDYFSSIFIILTRQRIRYSSVTTV